jgi:hypothetical protein
MADFVAKVSELEARGGGRWFSFDRRGLEGFAHPALGLAQNDRWRRWTDDLREAPQVLCDRCQCELELRTTRAPQT